MENVVEVRGMAKEYPGFAMHDVELSLPTGYVMGLIGPNGAGKSTLVKIILNAVHKDAGSVKIFGLDHQIHEADIKSRIGFVHENPPFYEHLTPLGLGRLIGPFYDRWSRDSYIKLLREFELPPGKRVKGFSRGMKMKLALAVALSHSADLLVLDEPTTGLDPVFRRELLDRLRDLLADEGKSILFSTHITSDLEQIADYVTYIRNGRISFRGDLNTFRDSWRIIKGGTHQLSEKLTPLLRSWTTHEFGFIALTDRIEELKRIADASLITERPTLDDLVFYLDGEEPNE